MYGKKREKTIKDCNVSTPIWLADYLSKVVLTDAGLEIGVNQKVFDPCMGSGNLLAPYENKGYRTWGVDIRGGEWNCVEANYLKWNISWHKNDIFDTALVVQNPPFNMTHLNDGARQENGRKPLLPELFLDKTWEYFGKNIPCVCIVPMGMRLNQRITSRRFRHMRDTYPDITSIISLPLDTFRLDDDGQRALIHCEALLFNLPRAKPHYFIPEEYLAKEE
jgi:hypothetical protein